MRNIEACHFLLNNLYCRCEKLYEIVKKEYKCVEMKSYFGHYIRIHGQYMYQKYYMPVISIISKGDICFNLDGVSLEFFLAKDVFLETCCFDKLFSLPYSVEIYDKKNSTIDFYKKGMSENDFVKKLRVCNCDEIGITINCQSLSDDDVISFFNEVCLILGLK